MRMRRPPFEIPTSDDPFENDRLDRKDQVEALTNFLHNLDGTCVLAVDAAWGSGKTVFLNMLAQNLRNQDFRVAEFNAWDTDFSKDPLIALFSALDDTLKLASESKRNAVLKAGAIVASKLASSVPFVPDVADAVADIGDQLNTDFQTRLKSHRETVNAIHKFKVALANVRDKDLPVVVCVDELDRCRPNYAIEFLEISKHLFDVDGVAFVLAVNLTELANSVQVMYGNNFDSNTYLRRFVDHILYLPKPDRTNFIDNLLESVGLPHIKDSSRFVRAFFNDFVLETSHISLRDIEQAICHLGLALKTLKRSSIERGVPMESVVTVLIVVRIVAPNVYYKFIRNEISDLEVVSEMTRMAGRSDDWWKSDQSNLRGLPRRIAIWEAILIGWGRYTSGSPEATSPLLKQRKSESTDQDNGYPDLVIETYREVSSTDEWKFRRALALIEMLTFDSAD